MKKLNLVFAFILLACISVGQTKLLTMQDAILNARTTLAAQNLKAIQFIKGTDDYVYLKKVNGVDKWIKGSFSAPKEMEYLNLTEINKRLRLASLDTLTAMPVMQFSKSDWTVNIKGSKYCFKASDESYYSIISKEIAEKTNVEESSAGYVAYLDANNLFVSGGGKNIQVTTDGSKDIVYASSVHRDEFGITKGTFWSNSGKLLAFYRMDQSMVKDYPIINWATTPASVENIKYPMAGDTSHQVSLLVYNTAAASVLKLKTGIADDHYLTNVAWSPDDKYIFIAELNREQNDMRLNMYDAVSGNFIKTIREEKTAYGYVEPLVPVLFLKNSNDKFVFQTRIDGYNHLYLYDLKKNESRQLTSGSWEVVEVKGFDESGNNLFYVSTEQSPISRNLYRLDMKSGKRYAITDGESVHNTQFNGDGSFVIDIYSSINNPRTIQLIDTKSGAKKILLQAEDPLAEYAKGNLSIFTIDDKKGASKLYCRMFRPVDFDSTKKYPVVVYWYGGPHNQLISNSWNGGAGDYWFQYMAENGFVVFSIDVHGSSYRGREFEQAIFRNIGARQMEDLMAGVDYLKNLPFVDASRMGLFGWSFGGFLTTNTMLTYPGVFKAAVAGGPVIDWRMYEVMYTERYMDKPQENPEGYEANNLINKVANLKGKLLLIHGLQDPVVVQQHSVNFVKAAVDKGIMVDYMIYPGHEHNVLGKDRAHLYQKVTDYFFQYLK